MKRTFYILYFILQVVACLAQSQSGKVKTLGRPTQKGVPLPGVTVRVMDCHNANNIRILSGRIRLTIIDLVFLQLIDIPHKMKQSAITRLCCWIIHLFQCTDEPLELFKERTFCY